MYNGVGLGSTKGTGLSGYIQRSRVTVRQALNTSGATASASVEHAALVSPLEAARSLKENTELTAFLADHDRRRSIKLKVAEYEQQRLQDGTVSMDVVAKECELMRASLLQQYESELEVAHAAGVQEANHRDATAFAEAFGLSSKLTNNTVGDSFNRQQRDEARLLKEQQRREEVEKKLLERMKKIRHE